MAIYVSYEPHKGNVWGTAIFTKDVPIEEIKKRIEEIKAECAPLGITPTFQTGDELLGDFLKGVEEIRNRKH